MKQKFPPHFFGNGADGYRSITGAASFIIPTYYSDLVIDGGTVTMGTVPVFVQGVLEIKGVTVAQAQGGAGASGGGSGTAVGIKTFACDAAGASGNPSTNGSPGAAPSGSAHLGGDGGGGGDDGSATYSGGAGGNVNFDSLNYGDARGALGRSLIHQFLNDTAGGSSAFTNFGGGASGGSGAGGNPGGPGAGGGGGGGIMWFCADTIFIGEDAILSAAGGAGGIGPADEVGGGGGGGGGAIVFVCNNIIRETPTGGLITARGGSGGLGHNTGQAGTDGQDGYIHIYTPRTYRRFVRDWLGTKI